MRFLAAPERRQEDDIPAQRSSEAGQAAAVDTWDIEEEDWSAGIDRGTAQRNASEGEWDTGTTQWIPNGRNGPQPNGGPQQSAPAADTDWDTGVDPWDTGDVEWNTSGVQPGSQPVNDSSAWDTGAGSQWDTAGSGSRGGGGGPGRSANGGAPGGASQWDTAGGDWDPTHDPWDSSGGAASPSAEEEPPLQDDRLAGSPPDRVAAATAEEELSEARKPYHR